MIIMGKHFTNADIILRGRALFLAHGYWKLTSVACTMLDWRLHVE
jgi:hypothetical protein